MSRDPAGLIRGGRAGPIVDDELVVFIAVLPISAYLAQIVQSLLDRSWSGGMTVTI